MKDEDLKTSVSSDLSLQKTQSASNSDDDDDERMSPISSYHFVDEENLGKVQLLPSPPPDYAKRLLAQVRNKRRRGKKSPQDYWGNEDEDTLFSVPSLIRDPTTMRSSSSIHPLDIQDSRILHVKNARLGWKKSHAVLDPPPVEVDSSAIGSESELTIMNS
uniref:Uncharacterized protein n=1 Tax=Caenorhabditis japonica TaxID=281687 RepID=A0A8R1HRA9_CAEJA